MDPDDAQINKSLRFSFLDGVFASAMVGFIQDYLTPFLLLLGATARHVGMLSAFPNLCASLVQLKSPDLVEKIKSRRKITNIFVFLQALMLLPMAAAAFFHGTKPSIFILFVVLFTAFGAVSLPGWASLMSDLIAKDKRGEYFGWRNKVLGFITVALTFVAGFLLYQMKKIDVFYGFAVLFSFAFIFRMISWYFLTRMHEPHLEHKKEDRFSLFDFLARIKESNFAQFVLFVSLMNFSVYVASPFFTVLMLKDLSFNYLTYTIVSISATLTIYIMMSRWGRHADIVGNIKVIRFTAPLIGIIPLLWILNRNPLFLIFAQIISGFVWAGFNLSASNFIYDAVSPEKRTRCIAYFNVFNGSALCSGALLGGFLVPKLPALFGFKILTIFLISAILRMIVGIFMPMKLKEVRPIENVTSNELFFSVIGIKPLLGIERKTLRY